MQLGGTRFVTARGHCTIVLQLCLSADSEHVLQLVEHVRGFAHRVPGCPSTFLLWKWGAAALPHKY